MRFRCAEPSAEQSIEHRMVSSCCSFVCTSSCLFMFAMLSVSNVDHRITLNCLVRFCRLLFEGANMIESRILCGRVEKPLASFDVFRCRSTVPMAPIVVYLYAL